MHRNRLHGETSRYLLQHADNPVDWYPWGDEAFARARAENKPVLLSIGYSACHWCHVMAHESFEDPATAAVMNARFVNVKVDREERPDVDRIYQIAQQLIARSPGGWPLTMFLAPDRGQPFFGGTYFSKDAARGLPSFRDLLVRIADYYAAHRAEIAAQAGALDAAFDAVLAPGGPPDAELDAAPLATARAALARAFDPEHGGFGGAPKFPQVPCIERALRHWRMTSAAAAPDLQALFIASLTLTRMAEGGIYDQVGGGFHRYSVDRSWTIPHFEKMLYDNALLLAVYAEAHLATGEPLFACIAAGTADWALREMRSPEGAFHASLDADSDGGEGRYYVWDRAEVERLLEADVFAPFAARYGLDGAPNFGDRWHLRAVLPIEAVAERFRTAVPTLESGFESARRRLLAARSARNGPSRDEKVLTSWNALMIRGLAIAARSLDRVDLADAATDAADFLAGRLWRDGRLLAVFAGGRARFPAYLDDHAFLLDAMLELLQARWRSRDFDHAVLLADSMLERFEDPAGGGFFFTAAGEETPMRRAKAFGDESLPAGNGVAAGALIRLAHLSGDLRYLRAARRALAAAGPAMSSDPEGHMSMINALERLIDPPQVVVVRGPRAECTRWAREIGRIYAPARSIFAIPGDEPGLARCFADKPSREGTVAYVCTGTTCSAPIADLAGLVRVLRGQNAPAGPGNSIGLANPSAETDATPKK